MTRSHVRGRLDDGAPNPIDVHVGQRMRIRRTLLGLSQEKVAEAIGLTFQQVQKYERGANRISCSRLFDLAQVLGVPVSFFFDDMPDSVQSRSPVNIIKGSAAAPAAGAPAAGVPDPLTSRETLDLIRHYYALPAVLRDQVYALARTLAEAQARAVGEAA